MRLIDADALKTNFEEVLKTLASYDVNTITEKMVISIIDQVPTAKTESELEAVPAQIGDIEWDTQFVIASCGVCGTRLLGRSEDITTYFKYCPTCGRKVKWNETN